VTEDPPTRLPAQKCDIVFFAQFCPFVGPKSAFQGALPVLNVFLASSVPTISVTHMVAPKHSFEKVTANSV